jgi:hypothetical protein
MQYGEKGREINVARGKRAREVQRYARYSWHSWYVRAEAGASASASASAGAGAGAQGQERRRRRQGRGRGAAPGTACGFEIFPLSHTHVSELEHTVISFRFIIFGDIVYFSCFSIRHMVIYSIIFTVSSFRLPMDLTVPTTRGRQFMT